MSLSRRQFIKASGVALCAGAAPLKAHAAGQHLRCRFRRCWNLVAASRCF
ncbi:hypothetical protein BN18_0291 [Klebsiella pneumoniae subsp. pneumoniae ST512-K30BO]|nr:hypothetical protein BN18_0291 [Klebsiella pneumoniae subsp. pneumoniae ST512-K30BO]